MIKTYKIFIVLLILALSVLLYLGSNSYKQIRELEKTAEMVMHTLRVETEINSLFSQYAMMQSRIFENKLLNNFDRETLLKNQKDTTLKIFKRLNILTKDNLKQQQNLKELIALEASFYKSIEALNNNATADKALQNAHLSDVSTVMRKIETIKANMLGHEEILLSRRQEEFSASRRLNPIMTLFLGMFALLIFIISFWQINKQRKKNDRTTAFLESVLKNTENVVSYYTPIKDDNDKITDFEIVYVNENIEDVLGTSALVLEGKLLSKVLPIHFENGVFDAMVTCYNSGETQRFEKTNNFNNTVYRFKTNVVKLNDGVLATASDTTEEHAIKQNLISAKNQLETQNLLLLDTVHF